MATPPKWEKKLVLALVNQVGAQIVFQGIFNHKMKVFRNNTCFCLQEINKYIHSLTLLLV